MASASNELGYDLDKVDSKKSAPSGESLAKRRLMEMELSATGVRSNRQVIQVSMETILLCLSTKVALGIPVVWRFLMPVRG